VNLHQQRSSTARFVWKSRVGAWIFVMASAGFAASIHAQMAPAAQPNSDQTERYSSIMDFVEALTRKPGRLDTAWVARVLDLKSRTLNRLGGMAFTPTDPGNHLLKAGTFHVHHGDNYRNPVDHQLNSFTGTLSVNFVLSGAFSESAELVDKRMLDFAKRLPLRSRPAPSPGAIANNPSMSLRAWVGVFLLTIRVRSSQAEVDKFGTTSSSLETGALRR
jgi:hypothetical protein